MTQYNGFPGGSGSHCRKCVARDHEERKAEEDRQLADELRKAEAVIAETMAQAW